MRPTLFQLGPIPMISYHFFLVFGALACVFYCRWIGRRVGLRGEIFLDLGILGIIGGFVGARLLHIVIEAPRYYWDNASRIFDLGHGGSVSFGAYLGGGLGIIAYLYLKKLDVLRYADVVALGLPILLLCGRFACLLAGCCYGKPTDLPWGILFTYKSTAAYGAYPHTPLHPAQMYEMVLAVLLFAGLNLWYLKKHRFPGQCILLFFIAYLAPRGILEFWRGDVDRGFWFYGLLSTGQVASIIGTAGFLFLYLCLQRRHRRA